MTLRMCVLAMLLTVSTAGAAPTTTPPARTRVSGAVFGDYWAPRGSAVHVTKLESGYVRIQCAQHWDGVGLLDGAIFLGAFRSVPGDSVYARSGFARVDFRDPDQPQLTMVSASTGPGDVVETWSRKQPGDNPPPRMPESAPPLGVAADPENPKFGEYVYVEELPEAITKVPPAYPDAARNAKVEGTVIVQALVRRDGSVGSTLIGKFVPGLDDAAMTAVQQWKFKPAMAKGQPVAVWMAVPVKFSLH